MVIDPTLNFRALSMWLDRVPVRDERIIFSAGAMGSHTHRQMNHNRRGACGGLT
jgi:hypothetical protein